MGSTALNMPSYKLPRHVAKCASRACYSPHLCRFIECGDAGDVVGVHDGPGDHIPEAALCNFLDHSTATRQSRQAACGHVVCDIPGGDTHIIAHGPGDIAVLCSWSIPA